MSERVQLTTEQAVEMLPDGDLLTVWIGAQKGGRIMQPTSCRRAYLILLIVEHGASSCYGQSGFQIIFPNGDYWQVETKRKG